MFSEYEKQIREQAQAAYPNEAVWLITAEGCRQVDNQHEDPANHFKVSRADMIRAMTEGLLAVVHSHPDRPDVPSSADMSGQINTAVPWGILTSTADGVGRIRWWGGDRAPLLGRPFVHGISDCYALIRDYHFLEMDIDLMEFPRDWEWWNNGEDLFMDGFDKAGFVRVAPNEVQPGDMWLARIRSPVINHGGIFLGGGLMIHQIGNPGNPVDHSRLSAREPISRYLPHIAIWGRYQK